MVERLQKDHQEPREKSQFTFGESKENFSLKNSSSQIDRMISKTPKRKYEENDLTRLLDLYPEKEWDYSALSANPNITWEYIRAHPKIDWNYQYLSGNSNITWDIIQENLDSLDSLGEEWCYLRLSTNPNITWEIVQAHPKENWDCDWLSHNPSITWENIQSTKNRPDSPGGKWNYIYLSDNSNITWDIVQAHPEIEWNYYELSANPNITWEIVQANPNPPGGEWKYNWLSRNRFLHDKNSVRYKKVIEKIRQEAKRVLDPYIIKDITELIGKYF